MNEDKFTYTYSAPTEQERKEIESIRRTYAGEKKQKTSIERLRELDGKVKNPANIISLCFGIIGTLIFGLGLTLVLEWAIWIWGIVLMIIGIIPIAIAYPVYKAIITKQKSKYGKEILEISEELLNQ